MVWKKKSDLCHNVITNLDTKPNDALSFPFFSFCHHHHSTTLTHLRCSTHTAEDASPNKDMFATSAQDRKEQNEASGNNGHDDNAPHLDDEQHRQLEALLEKHKEVLCE